MELFWSDGLFIPIPIASFLLVSFCSVCQELLLRIVGLLFENRPALYFCNYKENKKSNIRMLDTLFIEDFIDSMEE